jgi:DNA-binding NarL/FixJ family response regulator
MGVDEQVRVLVVDDSDVARSALAGVIAATSGFTVVGSSGSGAEALDLLPRLDPDLVLLDVHMPGLSGPQTAQRIADVYPDVAVVLVSAETPDLAGSPVAAFLPKSKVSPSKLRDLWTAVRSDASGLRGEARQARRRAQELGTEAEALRSQAGHQVNRTKRIRRPPGRHI